MPDKTAQIVETVIEVVSHSRLIPGIVSGFLLVVAVGLLVANQLDITAHNWRQVVLSQQARSCPTSPSVQPSEC